MEIHMTEEVNIDIRPLVERVKDVLRTCYDPEIPVNILELGLIYEIKVDEGNDVHVKNDAYFSCMPGCGIFTGRSGAEDQSNT
jgi:metal-sulfur cluster biosynthetic enzyme